MEMDVETECAICGQVLCVPVTTTCRHTFCRGCLSVWLFEHEQSTCPACRGSLDESAVDESAVDSRADEAARRAFPAEWQARREAARASSEQLWLTQLPYLLCQDPDCARMVRGLGRDYDAMLPISLSAKERTREAMLALPRRWFLPPSQRNRAYDGNPARLPSLGFNVSAPGMHAHALDLLDLQPGHTFLDVGSGCGILTCLAATLVYPGGEARGIDIRQRAIDFSKRNMRASCELLRRFTSSAAAIELGAAYFQGTLVRTSDADAATQDASTAQHQGGGAHETDANADADADAPHVMLQPGANAEAARVMLQVTADLGQGRFEAVMAHVKASYLAPRGVVWTRCQGMLNHPQGEIVLEEIQVLQVTAIGARTGREAPVEYVLKRTQSGALCGTYTSGCGETGTCHLRPVDVEGRPEALESCLVFEKGNVFNEGEKLYDRIHVGANIPPQRHLDIFKMLKPGGLLVGPMGDRMVLVSRKQTNKAAEKSCRRAAEGGHTGAGADAERTHSDGALADDALADADAHADDAHADAAAKDVQGRDNMKRAREEEQKRNNGHAGVDAERTHSDGALAEAKRNNIASGLGDGHEEEEEEDEEHFTVRETMHVRYGDLILPEMEEEELKGEGGSARAPLDRGSSGADFGGSGGRDMLVCRACCFPIVLADAAEEPMDLGIGEQVRLHGVGTCVLVADSAQPHILLQQDCELFRKAELGLARAAACRGCGLFLGLKFDVPSPPDVLSNCIFDALVHGPGLPAGSLLLPRSFVVRASEAQLEALALSRSEDRAYLARSSSATSRARVAPHTSPLKPAGQEGAAAAAAALPQLSGASNWRRLTVSGTGRGAQRGLGREAGGYAEAGFAYELDEESLMGADDEILDEESLMGLEDADVTDVTPRNVSQEDDERPDNLPLLAVDDTSYNPLPETADTMPIIAVFGSRMPAARAATRLPGGDVGIPQHLPDSGIPHLPERSHATPDAMQEDEVQSEEEAQGERMRDDAQTERASESSETDNVAVFAGDGISGVDVTCGVPESRAGAECAARCSSTSPPLPPLPPPPPPFIPWGINGHEREIRCAAPGCEQLLSSAVQIMSKKHSWSLSSNSFSETAWFVNMLVPSAVKEQQYQHFNLAQGPMLCCGITCSSCGSELGWRFGARVRREHDKLLSYQGRYGLVASAVVSAPGPKAGTAAASDDIYGCEADDEDEDDLSGSGRMRVPMALLQHLFGLRDSLDDGQTLDLAAVIRQARRPASRTFARPAVPR